MISAPLLKKRIMFFGIVLIIIGLALIHLMFNFRSNMPLKGNELFFLSMGFLSVAIVFSGSLIFGAGFGAHFPLKAFLIAIFIFGIWIFLVMLPIMKSSLHEEVSVLVISFSGLAFGLITICCEKLITKWKEKHGKVEKEVNV